MSCSGNCGCDGCCAGTELETPAVVVNPPGQSALAYRVGTHGQFLSSMRARLSSPAYPGLSRLTVRGADDPAIALLDAWAVVGELLGFYSERIADEGYLRTATEDRSIQLLGRLVGYRPRPGVAAGTALAYTLDPPQDPAGDTQALLPRGTRAQSVPTPGHDSQYFEIADDLDARSSLNQLSVLTRLPYQLTSDHLRERPQIYLAGTANNVKPGDQLLFVFSAEPTAQDKRLLIQVPSVAIDQAAAITVVGLPGQAQPTLDTLTAELKLWLGFGTGNSVQPKSVPSPNPPPEGSAIAARFQSEELLAKLNTVFTSVSVLADALDQVRQRAVEAAAIAAPYPDVSTWINNWIIELSALRDKARLLEPPQPSGKAPARQVPEDALSGLTSIFGALHIAPNPPPSARDLPLEPASLYAIGSDLGPQLLAALDPQVQAGLYQAWQHTGVTAPLALQELQSMRTVATPFGATAPLIPNLDPATGRVTGYTDWPLSGSKQLSLLLSFDDAGTVQKRADFTYVEGGSSPAGFDLPRNGTFNLGPGQVKLTSYPTAPSGPHVAEPGRWPVRLPGHREASADAPGAPPAQEPGLQADYLGQLPHLSVFVGLPTADDGTVTASGKVHVVLTDDRGGSHEFHLAEGDKPTPTTIAGMVVSLERTASGSKTPSVTVTLTSPTATPSKTRISLDSVYDGIAVGSWVVISRPSKAVAQALALEAAGSSAPAAPAPTGSSLAQVITRVTGVRVLSRADYGITAKVTQLDLADPWLDDQDVNLKNIRDTTVYARGETLSLATEPVPTDVRGNRIELAKLYTGITPGRLIAITGQRTDIPGTPGVSGTELAMVAGVEQSCDPDRPGDTVRTVLTLAADLAFTYRRETVQIYGNVAAATQGASRDDPIGSGDASMPNQSFTLWQAPLTWLPAGTTPSGAASTLQVRVNGVLWTEVDSFAGRGPTERVYTTSTASDGKTVVTFGDGVHGARLPTGTENVRARYRVGLGRAGDVKAGQVTQLTTRPLGVNSVTNPVPGTGGADRDGPEVARSNIPLALTALDRLVSVPDYEDFARSYAGIGRASARRLSDGRRQVVHVTVAGVDDSPLLPDNGLLAALHAALAQFGDPQLPVELAVRELVLLIVAVKVKLTPDAAWDLVEPVLRRTLLDRLSVSRRQLGQPAYASEVIAAAQAVPGVDYVDLQAFTGVPSSITPLGLQELANKLAEPAVVVPARLAEFDEVRHTVTADPVTGATETLSQIAGANGLTVGALLGLNPGLDDVVLPKGASIVVFRGIRPAQLVVLSDAVPNTLILREVK